MAAIDTIFEAFQRPGVPGASLAVVHNDELVYGAAWGLADPEAGRPATPTTNYRLASVTKQFTAAAIVLLAREGKLALDDPAGRWLPHLPQYAQLVTVRQLLTHTSGLADYEDCIPAAQTEQVHDADIPGLLPLDAGLTTPPGTAYHYSNTGYVLLALIAEQAGGSRFGDVLRTRIFQPLGMTHTLAHEDGRTSVPERAYGYTWRANCFERTDQSITSATLGDGGVYSSAHDMARWAIGLERAQLLSRAELEQVFHPYVATGAGTFYGWGWFVGQHEGQPIVYHDGFTTGFRTAIVRYPGRNLAVIVLANRTVAEPIELAHLVAREC
jgi:CubicO group peptidase (beta-lactamase class C family)